MNIDSVEPQKIDGLEESRNALIELLKLAHQQICWFSPDLDSLISDNPETYQLVSEFCRNNSRSQLKILLHDSKAIMSRGHQLIRLFQQLTSSIQIRNTQQDFIQQQPASFIIIDERHMLIRPISSQWQGQLILNNPVLVKNEFKFFNDAFEASVPDSQMRRLGI